MFQKLPTNSKIYALSAASPTESSWGTYCSPNDVVQGKHIGSCLGDLFSVNFIEDLDKGNYYSETLGEHFKIIANLTNLSKVMQWGDLSFQSDKVGDFTAGTKSIQNNLRFIRPIQRVGAKHTQGGNMNSRTMKLQSLSALYARDHSQETFQEMVAEMASMQRLDSTFSTLQKRLSLTTATYSPDINFNCLRSTVEAYEQKCGKLSDYGLQYVKHFAIACEQFESQKILSEVQC
jgi:legumain